MTIFFKNRGDIPPKKCESFSILPFLFFVPHLLVLQTFPGLKNLDLRGQSSADCDISGLPFQFSLKKIAPENFKKTFEGKKQGEKRFYSWRSFFIGK